MTSIFQTLIDFLQFFFNPLYLVISNIVYWISDVLMHVFGYFLYFVVSLLNMVFYCFGWVIDKFLLMSMSGLNLIFGGPGILSSLPGYTTYYTFYNTVAGYGWIGITWVQNYINISTVLYPFITYFFFLTGWTAYKIIKSWIPTVSG